MVNGSLAVTAPSHGATVPCRASSWRSRRSSASSHDSAIGSLSIAAVVAVDVLLGVVLAFKGKAFDLRKIADFVVTTVGVEKTLAFIGAVGLLYLRHDAITAAVVAGLATVYATSVLPDLYYKVRRIFFRGVLPEAQPAPA